MELGDPRLQWMGQQLHTFKFQKGFFKVKACLYTNIHSRFIGSKHCKLAVCPSMNE